MAGHRNTFPEPFKPRSMDAPRIPAAQYQTCPKYISIRRNRRRRCKFSVLSIIVNFLKAQHYEGETEPFTIEDILDETNLLFVEAKVKEWLVREALLHNPKVQVIEGKYLFKPPLPITDRRSLLKMLQHREMKCLGGVMLADVQESVPCWENVMKQVEGEVVSVVRKLDKKQIIFYKDKSISLPVDEDLVHLWRRLPLVGVTDGEIEDYLMKEGFKPMQVVTAKEKTAARTKKHHAKKPTSTILRNHARMLQDF